MWEGKGWSLYRLIVQEGVIPFLCSHLWRRLVVPMAQVNDSHIRVWLVQNISWGKLTVPELIKREGLSP